MKDNNEVRTLIDIPADGNYIEILGHRIDGFESFEAFLEHLKKYAVLEETVKAQKAEIERLTKQTELDDKYIKSLEKAFNDRTAELQTAKLDIKQLHTDVERIDSRRIKDCRYWQSKYSSLRAEAVKEFAERLKDYYTKKKIYDRPNAHTLIGFLFSLIDDIAEEMVGE